MFATGAALRVALAIVNREANDDHMAVSRIIALQHRFPGRFELAEAYHPKLYHLTVAVVWRLTGLRSNASLVVVGQLVSAAAGIATVALVGIALRRWDGISPSARLGAFAFVALNPVLIGISAQATNDAFVTCFSTAALLAATSALRDPRPRTFALTAGAVVAALFSKTSAVVVFEAIAACFLVAIFRPPPAWRPSLPRSGTMATLVTGGIVILFVFVGPFRSNYNATGDWFAINVPRDPHPGVLAPTFVGRPGTISIVDSYATFDLWDMLQHPFDTNGLTPYPTHRTSLWSQVYGRAWDVHFPQWPPSWADHGPIVRHLSQVILVVGLVPTAALLWGLVLGALRAVRGDPDAMVLCVVALVMLVYLAAAAYSYRDFATMKAEYMYPALVGFVFALALGLERLVGRWGRTWVTASLTAGALDVVLLIVRLS